MTALGATTLDDLSGIYDSYAVLDGVLDGASWKSSGKASWAFLFFDEL